MPPCKTINFYYELSLMSQNPPVGRFWPISARHHQPPWAERGHFDQTNKSTPSGRRTQPRLNTLCA